jgi:hypothetical protein
LVEKVHLHFLVPELWIQDTGKLLLVLHHLFMVLACCPASLVTTETTIYILLRTTRDL